MAKLVRCDRCGTLEPENGGYDIAMTPQYVIGFIDSNTIQKDLCCKCAADFKAFMRNEDVGSRYVVKKED